MITHRVSRYADGRLDGDVECSVLVAGEMWTSRDRILWVSLTSGRRITPPRTEAALARRVAYCGMCGHRITAEPMVQPPTTTPTSHDQARTSTTA